MNYYYQVTTNTLKMTTRLRRMAHYVEEKVLDTYIRATGGYIDDTPSTPDPIQASLDHICDKTREFLNNRKKKGEKE